MDGHGGAVLHIHYGGVIAVTAKICRNNLPPIWFWNLDTLRVTRIQKMPQQYTNETVVFLLKIKISLYPQRKAFTMCQKYLH